MNRLRKIIKEQLKNIFEEKLSNFILEEEYDKSNHILYGYHVTPLGNVDDIKKNGFKIGSGQMQGKGFYAFYDYDHAVRYRMKDPFAKLAIVKFEITRPKSLLYLNMNIAKEVLGPDYHLSTQLDRYYKYEGGIDYAFKLAQPFFKNLTMDEYLEMLKLIETDNSESNQRKLPFQMMPYTESDKLNKCWDGNYGLEYRINNLSLTMPIGYILIDTNHKETYVGFSDSDKIPDTEEFSELKKVASNFTGNLSQLRRELDKKQLLVRNNREYDYYANLLDKLRKIGYY